MPRTDPNSVDTGTYYVSETDPGPYSTSLDCVDNSTDPATPVAVGANNSVDVTSGSVIVCTFTNTRNQGSIELKKHWVGHGRHGDDQDRHLGRRQRGRLGRWPNGADATTDPNSVDTGTYYVSETDPGPYGTSSTASTTAPTRPLRSRSAPTTRST